MIGVECPGAIHISDGRVVPARIIHVNDSRREGGRSGSRMQPDDPSFLVPRRFHRELAIRGHVSVWIFLLARKEIQIAISIQAGQRNPRRPPAFARQRIGDREVPPPELSARQ